MISISGIRGIYGDGLSDEIAEKFAYSFGKLHQGNVVVGRDSRLSGSNLMKAVADGLRKSGADVILLGLASTPTTEMAVVNRKASGGIIITASHNPGEWNGLKLLGPDGVFLDSSEGGKVLDIYNSTNETKLLPLTGNITEWDGADEYHINSILSLDIIDTALISSKKFRVCIDSVNGAGGKICNNLLYKLGCEAYSINDNPNGVFPHGAEPVAENLTELSALVKEKKALIGFAVDPDVDRLSLIDENGKAVGEEYSLALATGYMLDGRTKVGACNLSTSRMIEDAAEKFGGKIFRSAVGEINVVKKMRETGAGIGGEGNGGIIYPPLHYGRDAVFGIALVLQLLAENNLLLSKLVSEIPSYVMIKEKIEVSSKDTWREKVKNAFAGSDMDFTDGIKITFSKSWVHIRESNTEPIIRVISEAPDTDSARSLISDIYKALKN